MPVSDNPLFKQIADRGSVLGMTDVQGQTSREWFRNQAQLIGKVSPDKLMASGSSKEYISFINPMRDFGKMVMFFYDAKTKEKLPYWDRFPLVFPFKNAKGGFLGLNMHYLSPYQRAKLMDALYKATVTNINKVAANDDPHQTGGATHMQRMAFSYQILKKTSSMRGYKACLKHYLNAHVKSRFMVVDPTEWDMILMLKTAQFITGGTGPNAGGSFAQTKVFSDSIRKIK